jgi:DNA-binding CsgD family transcriptional regulator
MTSTATATAPISGLLSLVAGALDAGTPAVETAAPAPTPDLSTALGQLAGAWMAVKEDGEGWMLLQFAPSAKASVPTEAAPVVSTGSTDGRDLAADARPLATRPDFTARARRVHTALTEREREVLCLVATGATNCAIAARLFISPKTASVHVSRILTKLDATTRTEAAALAHASGLIRPYGAVVA